MTTLDRLKVLCLHLTNRNIFSDTEYLGFLEAYALTGTEDWTSENDDAVWLAFADVLETYIATTIDYDQGEITEQIDRSAIAEQIAEIRRRHTVAELKDVYSEGEETWF